MTNVVFVVGSKQNSFKLFLAFKTSANYFFLCLNNLKKILKLEFIVTYVLIIQSIIWTLQ